MEDNFVDDDLVSMWTAGGRSVAELQGIVRGIAEQAFIEAMRPTPEQVARWKATGQGQRGLAAHIAGTSGKVLNVRTVERLWRLYTGQKQTRRAQPVEDFKARQSDGMTCRHCGSTAGPFHVDHVAALGLGGEHEEGNFQILCKRCNLRKGKKIDLHSGFIRFADAQV